MPSPVFWIVVAFAAVFIATSHLCLGFVLGRRTASREVVRKTRKALAAGVAQSTSHEVVAERLHKQVEQVAAVCRSLPDTARETVEKILREVLLTTASLRDALHENTAMQNDALDQLAQPQGGPSQSNASHQQKPRFTLEIEDHEASAQPAVAVATESRPPAPRLATEPSAQAVPSQQTPVTTEAPEQIQSKPWPLSVAAPPSSRVPPNFPATPLSSEEVEQMRTGNAALEDARREETRYPYCASQFVAEVHGKSFPRPDEFVQVMCRDISRSGISFFSTKLPASPELIITLGVPPDLTFLNLHVVNHRQTTLDDVLGYAIGCVFAPRVAPGIYAWDAERGCIDFHREELLTAG